MAERIRVFVVEQNCPYQEVDEHDREAYHLLLKDDQNKLVGYTRIFSKNSEQTTFGRVLVPKQYRNKQYGRRLVKATIEQAQKLFPNKRIQIQAQAYLKDFYRAFGFQPISEVYLEDGIPHLDMLL
ncbi:GNAT family N-acetyltransferase [Lapidilactobacillus bayanensis]|uniref:GNAT family N-acetyltransferase n=1 Tax=Lapidilactobacillus bayanensis TaxID=2485998 RepID=UPI00384CF2C1